MSEIPYPNFELDEGRFVALFGPLVASVAQAWDLYREAAEEFEAWSAGASQWDELDLDDEDAEYEFPAMMAWRRVHDSLVEAMDDEQAEAFLETLLAQFVDDVTEAAATMAMIVERQPSLAEPVAERWAEATAEIESMFAERF